MGSNSRCEVLERSRERYLNRGKEGRGRLLDEICSPFGYERKYEIKVLGGARPIAGAGCKKLGAQSRNTAKRKGRFFRSSGWLPSNPAASG